MGNFPISRSVHRCNVKLSDKYISVSCSNQNVRPKDIHSAPFMPNRFVWGHRRRLLLALLLQLNLP